MKKYTREFLLASHQASDFTGVTPLFFRLNQPNDVKAFETLLEQKTPMIHDEMDGQLSELIKLKNPQLTLFSEDYRRLIKAHLNGVASEDYGVWVYYPWSNRLVHLLDETEFVEIRTIRNKYKISAAEQAILATKRVGVIGLSVGQSVALTLAMERLFGELRIADFDVLELTNLNRIRTGVQSLGLLKVVMTAREIAEVDPFLKVTIYSEGVSEHNLDDFLMKDGKLDLLIDECDGFDMKIMSRQRARALRIPVLMDASDRGLLDIERFDLEPDRPLLHGMIPALDPYKLKNLSNEEKAPYMEQFLNFNCTSTRLKASFIEINQTLTGWPQLASSVILGGAVTADTCRRIFLDQFHTSGRFYIDLEELIREVKTDLPFVETKTHKTILTQDKMKACVARAQCSEGIALEKKIVEQIAYAASMAPSGGNAQPWKLFWKNRSLFIFYNDSKPQSVFDPQLSVTYIGLGAAIENAILQAQSMNFKARLQYFPLSDEKALIARINFSPAESSDLRLKELAAFIPMRMTNRNKGEHQELSLEQLRALQSEVDSFQEARIQFATSSQQLSLLGELAGQSERIRMLHPQGHADLFKQEIRWSTEESLKTRDGIDIETLELSPAERTGFNIARDPRVIAYLREARLGHALAKLFRQAIEVASAVSFISMRTKSSECYLEGGRVMQRVWLKANLLGIACHPSAGLLFIGSTLKQNPQIFNSYEKQLIDSIQTQFCSIFKLSSEETPIFLFRLFKGELPKIRALRKPLDEVLIFET